MFQSPFSQNQPMRRQIPRHWIGARRGWKSLGLGIVDALIHLSPSQLRTHAHLLGATGCGKTTLIHHMIAQDLSLGHSVVVLDLRGDLVNATIELCEGQVEPQLLKILDLREKHRPFGFNPLKGDGESYFRALAVLDAVAHEAESWGVQLSETLRNGLLLLAVNGHPLTRLESIFHSRHFRAQCLKSVRSESLKEFWGRFEEMSPDRQAALAMPVMNKVSLLLCTDTLRRILSHESPIDLETQLNTAGSVTLVSLAVDELHGAGRMMGNMFLASLCREVFARGDIPESRRNPVRLYVDEFENFEMGLFESILAEGRRYGVSLVVSHQTLAQLDSKTRSIVLNNVGTKVVFRTGREDSVHMSKDLFADGQAYDFTDLLPGESVLWRRGMETIELEVNEPLFFDVGVRSEEARQYLDEVYAYAGTAPAIEQALRQSVSPPPPSRFPTTGKSGLESWL